MEICSKCGERIMWGECGCPSPKDTKAYQWLYKPKTLDEWRLHTCLMTEEEAATEFKSFGTSYEYKKLT